MKKIAFIAILAAFAAVSCVKDDIAPKKEAGPEDVDYTGLVLNEINGTGEDAGKYIELYNNSSAEIALQGVEITYNGVTSWTGKASDKIAAGGYLVLQGSKGTGALSTGLSAGKQIKVELLDPSGNQLDYFQRGNGDGNTSATGATDMDYSRMPNGLGAWYLTDATGTKGVSNGTGTDGLTKVESAAPNDPITPPSEADYSGLVLNELDGNSKFIEFFNKGTKPIDLKDCKMYKDGDNTSPIWIGQAGMTLAAGAYLALDGVKGSTNYLTEFGSGLSAKANVKIELVDPSGNQIDVFTRGEEGTAWGDITLSQDKANSYSRVPNGTGTWVYALPTKGAANGNKVADIPQN